MRFRSSRPAVVTPEYLFHQEFYAFDDFIGNAIGNALGWTSATSGTAAASATTSSGNGDNVVGVWNLATGTDTTGRAGMQLSGSALRMSGGLITHEAAIRLSNLADGTDSYTYVFGFGDNNAAGAQTDGLYFQHDQTTANWIIAAAAGGVITSTTTSTAVVAASFLNLMIVANIDNSRAEFFVNGVSIGTLTTGLPTGSQLLSPGLMKIEKTAGVNSRTAQIDYVAVKKVFTTARV